MRCNTTLALIAIRRASTPWPRAGFPLTDKAEEWFNITNDILVTWWEPG